MTITRLWTSYMKYPEIGHDLHIDGNNSLVYNQRTRVQRDTFMRWMLNREWTFFVTLAFPCPDVQPESMRANLKRRDALKRWDALMRHACVGRRWASRPDLCPFGIFFPEKIISHPHFHGFTIVPKNAHRFERHAESAWLDRIAPGGTVDIQRFDPAKATNYIGKESFKTELFDDRIMTSEFQTD